jgi:CheY-like chemotaxis protein
MPVMDGVEATRRIMALQQGQNSRNPVPIIGHSASVQRSDDWRAAGMICLLGKPFTQKELRRVLGSLPLYCYCYKKRILHPHFTVTVLKLY